MVINGLHAIFDDFKALFRQLVMAACWLNKQAFIAYLLGYQRINSLNEGMKAILKYFAENSFSQSQDFENSRHNSAFFSSSLLIAERIAYEHQNTVLFNFSLKNLQSSEIIFIFANEI